VRLPCHGSPQRSPHIPHLGKQGCGVVGWLWLSGGLVVEELSVE
jgi:hypothetical protein